MENKDANGTNGVAKGTILGSVDAATTMNILEAKPLDKTSTVSAKPHIPSISASAVLGESSTMPEGTPICKGVDFNKNAGNSNDGIDMLDQMMKAFRHSGFQATNLGLAVEQIQQMRKWRLDQVPFKEGIDDPELFPVEIRKRLRARIFLAYTSNQISCGQREVLKFLVQHKMVDCIVTTAGGIEEDLMKCFEPTFMGDFKLNGRELRKKGINRIGTFYIIITLFKV
ncbi:MAG: deoxyhypusine synthase [Bacillariaceae sp.]|jgi:deoxyhypusine synthase